MSGGRRGPRQFEVPKYTSPARPAQEKNLPPPLSKLLASVPKPPKIDPKSPETDPESPQEVPVLRVSVPHPWNVPYAEARAIQERLRARVIPRGGPKSIRLVAGADVSYDKSHDRFYAAVVVMDFPQLHVIETVTATGRAEFPYIPGLLTFREGPILLDAFSRLTLTPDLVIFDGQGIAHPRGFGLAAHMGLILDRPSIGCAKTRLCGEYREPGPNVSDYTPLTYDGRIIGSVVRTRARVKPVFVSVGHRISLAAARRWVVSCLRGYRLPQPTRLAHVTVNRLRVNARLKGG